MKVMKALKSKIKEYEAANERYRSLFIQQKKKELEELRTLNQQLQ